MMKPSSVCLLVLLACTASAQEISTGKCPIFSVIQNFEPQRYLGRWFEYSNYFAIFQLFGDCVTADYSDVSETSGPTTVKVINSSVNKFTGNANVAEGSATLGEPDNASKPGKLIVNFDGQPSFARSTTTNYNILDTDYDSYAIVYSCGEKVFGLLKSEFLWILTRERNPSPQVIAKAKSIIKANGIDTRRLKKTKQTGCPA